ncbi:MAG: phosphoenolpyruvate carboxykinase (GTP) [Winkia neuii]|uniref:Phosphoenolpyruvate carboxykinase [GTP] n=1 Tax=Winkia neuii TaxID=33007 RepID=A0A2I1ILH9_9ACTO|nr:phosphoenolpyruvate carboxykinase (GTP) [Winkia neuii]OFJ69995.1 phosphoenolpyruvate carboxykinase [Actinomyces sp. HMSC064C12]OFK04502.1 phosphoenolpyruvate carboxykinase [Actinomyces sp. HMSC072A03]OFT56186.1 phosphoenolpyruvate carboxykinase [Actinomyces sp. HMSC06A08]MDU3135915.1 phosphoenolpyruvate carboxykinase (GTP) [Winkia neuii]PKY71942.1 phosphoenolpyruvate carboxykinase (GTP) [Winkia neuii]
MDVTNKLKEGGITNPYVIEYVSYWSGITEPDNIEVISAADDDRLIEEGLRSGEIFPAGKDLYYSRSYYKDTARSEERTVVATASESDKGVYNNWRNADRVVADQVEKMRGASKGKTMYVIPYLMSPQGSPLEEWARGVELTDNLTVCLHMIRMARVGAEYIENVPNPDKFVRAVHVTGDLENLGQGTDDDQRCFATIADERTILHFGSSYGGNALLGKIAHGLRQASYDGWVSSKFLAEQFLLIGIRDKVTGAHYYVCGGFPSASGKTNLAMTLAPDGLGDRYEVDFYGDDIVWLRVGKDGRIWGMNPENGAFGVAKDTNWKTNPTAMEAIQPGTKTLFTNVAYNPTLQEVWWEGKTEEYPEDVTGWLDWRGMPIAERPLERQRSKAKGDEWAHPNSRFTASLANVPNVAADFNAPQGVPIDAIIFGGRTRDREPLIRAITDFAEGVYDGLTLGAEATFAADGKEGQLRYDPMSMRPFMSYPEGDYAAHWLNILRESTERPIFAHVNWFARGEDGRFLWPGYRDNLRALLWLLDLKEGRVSGEQTPVGIVPKIEELNLEGFTGSTEDLKEVLRIDKKRWLEEMEAREEHLNCFDSLPKEIWEAHLRVRKALES